MEPLTPLPDPAERHRVRKRMGVTQAEAAALLNVSQRTWWRWEKGISKPHPRHYRRYAALLKEWAGI